MWIDNFDETGGTPILMPYQYFAEMICDYLAAGRAYMGKSFTFAAENEWWKKKRAKGLAMPEKQMKMIDFIFKQLAEREESQGTLATDEYFCTFGGRTLLTTTYDYYKDK
jgi:hypothetical protein